MAVNAFAFKGRVGRADYATLVGAVMIVRLVVILGIGDDPRLARVVGALDYLFVFIAALLGRRLRDAGYSAVWGWLGIFLVSFMLPLVIAIGRGGANAAIPAWIGLSSTGLLIAMLVAAGLLPGDPAANRYGEPADPIFK